MKHFSAFELDTWFASPAREREPACSAHLETCALCKQYVDALAADSLPTLQRRSHLRLAPAIVTTLAVAASLVLFIRSRAVEEESYVGVKGLPAAQVLVRSGGRVRLWDGERVHAGDALAVRVACAEFAHVTVASPQAQRPGRAWEGACTADAGEALPFTLVVDDQPGREHFDVVLSKGRLTDERLTTAIRTAARNGDTWTIGFDFDKEGN